MVNAIKDRMLVYVIQCGDFYKVGLSANIRHRLMVMALGNPYPLRLVTFKYIPKGRARSIEIAVHAKLSEHAIGREWFNASLEVIKVAVAETIEADKLAHGWNPTRDTHGYKGVYEELLSNK